MNDSSDNNNDYEPYKRAQPWATLPYNGGGEQQCSGRERQEMGEPMDKGIVAEQFAKAYIGMTLAEIRNNAQVQPCFNPSICAQQWSRLGIKHLREEYLRYRANSLDERALFLQEMFNELMYFNPRYSHGYLDAGRLYGNLEKQWQQVPFKDREDYRRKFCAFRILDENVPLTTVFT
ncbi:hypothetical protein COOONC_26577 [Cooperia oncophora]